MLKAVFLFPLLLLASSAALARPGSSGSSGERLNVLFLVADDLNSWLLDDADRYAGRVIAPNLRKLAASGVNFERAYAAAPICSPSRTAFFSGVSPWRSGHYHNALQVQKSAPLEKALSLAGSFKAAGYTTIAHGKITHGWDQRQHWDTKVGHKRDPAPPGAPLTSVGRGEQDWGPIHLAEEDMNSTQLADLTIEQLSKEHDGPFFLACGFFNPHMPWYVPQKYFDLFPLDEIVLPEIKKNDLDDVPPSGVAITAGKSKFVDAVLEAGLHKDAVRAYLATTAYVDHQMGRILDALEKSPHKDNTVVVFLTDHGFHLGEKHHWQKATLWEEATHTLLMFRAPGVTSAGAASERFVSLQDIYPTLVELCRLERPGYLDGRSLVPLLKEPDAEWKSTALTGLCGKAGSDAAYISLRDERGRYIRYVDGEEEFYDAKSDPREWTNRIGDPAFATVVAEMRAAAPSRGEMAAALPAVVRKKKR